MRWVLLTTLATSTGTGCSARVPTDGGDADVGASDSSETEADAGLDTEGGGGGEPDWGDGLGCRDLDPADRMPTWVDGWAVQDGNTVSLGLLSWPAECGEPWLPDGDVWQLKAVVPSDDPLPQTYSFSESYFCYEAGYGTLEGAKVEIVEVTDDCVIGRVVAAEDPCDFGLHGWFDIRRCN